jgi:hypothetical protein
LPISSLRWVTLKTGIEMNGTSSDLRIVYWSEFKRESVLTYGEDFECAQRIGVVCTDDVSGAALSLALDGVLDYVAVQPLQFF